MNILHLNFSDLIGGAARAAYGVHRCLVQDGVPSKMLVVNRRSRDSSVVRIQPSTRLRDRAQRALRRVLIEKTLAKAKPADSQQLFSDDRSWLGPELAASLPECDIVHLHWVAGMVDYRDFLPQVAAKKPIVWTLHDMNPFTGGCHYDYHCGNFATGCGNCPMLRRPSAGDLSRKILANKTAALASIPASRMRVVTPSQWLSAEASRSSALGKFPVSTIPYGLNLEDFAPRDKRFAREVLGIPSGARVVLFVAQTLSDKRKGHQFLLEALAPMQNVFLLSLGSGEPSGKANALHLGFVEQDRLLSLVYSAADVFAATSLQDNLPQTVLEAMACGLPVAGFKVGGIPDAIEDGVTGRLVPAGDSAQLRNALEELLSNASLSQRLSSQSRTVALEKFSAQSQARAYRAIYEQLLA